MNRRHLMAGVATSVMGLTTGCSMLGETQNNPSDVIIGNDTDNKIDYNLRVINKDTGEEAYGLPGEVPPKANRAHNNVVDQQSRYSIKVETLSGRQQAFVWNRKDNSETDIFLIFEEDGCKILFNS